MFCSVQDVKEFTGYEVTGVNVFQAQAVMEAYIGRLEVDVTGPSDQEILRKATAFQAAYMRDNYDKIFQQTALAQIVQNGSIISFKSGDQDSPYIAPLAKIACRSLSWRNTRSLRTGRMFPRGVNEPCTPWEAF